MEGRKSNKGLVICLIILLLAFASVAVLLGTGVVKSPFVKCEKCKDTTTTEVDNKTDSKTVTEKTSDERYKEYIKSLAVNIKNDYYEKSSNSGTSFSSQSYSTIYGNYRLSIDKDLKLIYAKENSDSTSVANNVVAYFRVHTGNGIPSTIYYITSDAKLYSVDLESSIDLERDYEIKEINIKNVVNVVPGYYNGDGGQRAMFIDIDGNVISEQ